MADYRPPDSITGGRIIMILESTTRARGVRGSDFHPDRNKPQLCPTDQQPHAPFMQAGVVGLLRGLSTVQAAAVKM